MKESEVQKMLLDYLRIRGWFAFKVNTAGIFKQKTGNYIPNPNRGCPDIFAAKGGITIAVEAKSEKGAQSDFQKEWQRNWEAAGCRYLLIHSLDELIKLL